MKRRITLGIINQKGANNSMFGKHFSKETKLKMSLKKKGIKTGNNMCKHHLDLNTKNNKEDNILILTNSKHQLFHRLAYHYLLKTFGIKEIQKYKKWFIKRT
jgi:hypothetical protein